MTSVVRAVLFVGLAMLLGCGGCGEPPIGPADAGATGGGSAGDDAGQQQDAGGSVDAGASADAGLDTDAGLPLDAGTDGGWYGFRPCAPPSNAMLPVIPAFQLEDGTVTPVTGFTTPRDLSFDGRGSMVIAARDQGGAAAGVFLVGSSGSTRTFFTTAQGSVAGARLLTDGHLVIAGSYPSGASVLPGITVLDGTSAVTGRLPFQRGFPWAVLATPNGGFTVFDSTIERLIVQFTSSTLPAVVLNAVDISMAMGTPPNQQRAAVLSADGRHLFVVSQEDAVIHEYALSATGVIDGASRRRYATLATSSFPRSLAFDECGNLYVNGTVVPTVGASTGMLWRIPAGGGPHVPLATIDPVDSHRVIAFGAGPGFSNTHLYVADVHSQLVRRINVGIPGQPVVTPR